MFKGDDSFLYRRGLFFILLCISSLTLPIRASEKTLELSGVVGNEGQSYAISFGYRQDWPIFNLELGFDGVYNQEEVKGTVSWDLQTSNLQYIQLRAIKNRNHYTSSDAFRLINKNNFGSQTKFIALLTEQVKLCFFRQIPLKKLDVVDAILLESQFELGPAKLEAFQLTYAGHTQSGQTRVFQGKIGQGSFSLQAAQAWQIDLAGQQHLGQLFSAMYQGDVWKADFTWQKVAAGFISPLAKTNYLTPDRQGWHLKLHTYFSDLDIALNLKRQRNIEFVKEYRQTSIIVTAPEKKTSLEWRLEPTPAFILRYKADQKSFVQVDVINGLLRYDKNFAELRSSFRFDLHRWIVRFELGINLLGEWRIIAKQDLLNKRSHQFLSLTLGSNTRQLKLELGHYDRGNIAAGFDHEPRFNLAWKWLF